MCKKELYLYIDELKQKGYLTSDELYYIGLLHRDMIFAERNWDELASYVNYAGSGDSYRKKVFRRAKKEGKLNSNFNGVALRQYVGIEKEDYEIMVDNLYKQKITTQDRANDYRRTLRDEARLDTIKEIIADSICEIKPLPKITFSQVGSNNKQAILLLSDLHIGAYCDNFYNKYNKVIAYSRLIQVVSNTIMHCKLHGVSVINVCNLGDLVQGIIHINSRISQQTDVIDQMITASEYISQMLNNLSSEFKVVYRSCTDNHSRVIADKGQHIEKENFNKIIDWYLQERLKDNKNVVFANDNLDDSIGRFEIDGKVYMFSHGHLDNANQVLQHFIGATQEFVDYVLLGHYHSEKVKTYQGVKVIVNGSIVGTEDYALSKRIFNKPSQTLLIPYGDSLVNVSIGLD